MAVLWAAIYSSAMVVASTYRGEDAYLIFRKVVAIMTFAGFYWCIERLRK